MSTSTIGIGAVGCGGRLRGILKRVLQQDERIELRALCDPSEASIAAARELAPAARCFDDHRAMAADPSVDWVFIGSLNCLHREHAVAALQAGKHVFCEKPLATNLDDCLAIREAWRAADRTLSLGFVLRYSPHYQVIREQVRSGRLGRILSMEFNETLDYEHGGFIHADWRRQTRFAGSHLLEKCCHDLDLVNWILDSRPLRAASFGGCDYFRPDNAGEADRIGPDAEGRAAFSKWPRTVNVSPFNDDKDIVDNQVAIVEYDNGTRATFHSNCCGSMPERRMYLCGSRGTLRADVHAGVIEFCPIAPGAEVERLDSGVRGGHGGADGKLAEHLAATLLNGEPPLASVDAGIESAVAAFGIDQAMAEGRVLDLTELWRRAGISTTGAAAPAVLPAAC